MDQVVLAIAKTGAIIAALGFVLELLAGDARAMGKPNGARLVSQWAVAIGFCAVVVGLFVWADLWMLGHAR